MVDFNWDPLFLYFLSFTIFDETDHLSLLYLYFFKVVKGMTHTINFIHWDRGLLLCYKLSLSDYFERLVCFITLPMYVWHTNISEDINSWKVKEIEHYSFIHTYSLNKILRYMYLVDVVSTPHFYKIVFVFENNILGIMYLTKAEVSWGCFWFLLENNFRDSSTSVREVSTVRV